MSREGQAGGRPPLDQPPTPVSPRPGGRPAWWAGLVLAVAAAGAVFALGALAVMTHPPVLAAAVVAAAVTACAVLAVLFVVRSPAAAAWWSAGGAVAAGWLAYAAVGGPWSWPAAAGLLVPTAVLARLWSVVRGHDERVAEARQRRRAEAGRTAERQKWPALLARIGYGGVTFVRRDDTLCGYSVLLSLPPTGTVTYPQLAASREKLEVAARARHGSLRLERGHAAHEVILHVAERDVLAETIPLPAESPNLTITQPIAIGVHEDGQVCTLTLREIATLIVGLRGSGKSNLLNVLIAQLARCDDVLIFVIDQKGGRMAAPWLQPWLSGKTPSPVIDWLATTREEAEVMLRACLRGIDARSRSGSGGEKIVPSARQPAVMLIVDEAAVIFGTGVPRSSLGGPTNSQLAALGTQITMLGRSEAIDPVFATQRGSSTMTGSGDLKSQCGLRIGLGVASEGDARLIIPDDVHIAADLATLAHPGSGIVQVKHGRVTPVKFFRIEHDQIGPIAERTGWIRPRPDPLLAEALGPDYAGRWAADRAGHLSRRAPRAPARPVTVPAPPGATEAEFQAIIARSGLADIGRPATTDAGRPAPTDAAGPAPAVAATDPARGRMRDYIRHQGDRGATAAMIHHLLASENTPVPLPAIERWLTEAEAAGELERGTLGRWRRRP
jgi:hypothetical protein